MHIEKFIPSEGNLSPDGKRNIFRPNDVAMGTTTKWNIFIVEKLRATRVALDPLSKLQLLASNLLG